MKRILLLAVTLVVSLCVCGLAQNTNASLTGVVTDKAEAIVSGATVTAQNVKTGVVTTTTTNGAGVIGLTNTPQIDDATNQINTDMNSANFGRITNTGGARIIVIGARINF